MLNCLVQCFGKLEPRNRELITRYYIGKERVKIDNRRSIADESRHNHECPEHSRLPDTRKTGSVCPTVCRGRVKDFCSIVL